MPLGFDLDLPGPMILSTLLPSRISQTAVNDEYMKMYWIQL